MPPLQVRQGKINEVHIEYDGTASYLSTTAQDFSGIQKDVVLEESLTAPFEKGTKVGEVRYMLEGKQIATVGIVTSEGCARANYLDCMKKVWHTLAEL